MVLCLQGDIDRGRAGDLWRRLSRELGEGVRGLEVDCDQVRGIDSAGIALLRSLHKLCRERNIAFEKKNIPEEFESFFRFAEERSDETAELPPEHPPGFISRAGLRTLNALEAFRDMAVFTGRFLLSSAGIVRHPRRLRVREILYQLQRAGAEAMGFIAWLAALMGFIMGIQATTTLTQFGADIRIADVVTFGTVQEMGPLLTAIILSGRSGAAYAAEIGTMKINQEIDGLEVMGLDPMRFLVLPRVLGLSMAGPLLTLIADAAGILGGLFVGMWILDLSFLNFMTEVGKVLSGNHFWEGLIKSFGFAVLIGVNGCFHGFRVGKAPEEVGAQTTASVVTGILLIVLADALLSGLFHVYKL